MAEEVKTKEQEQAALASQIAAQVKFPENLVGIVNEAVEKSIKDHGLDQVARKAGLFGGLPVDPAEERKRLRNAYLLAILKRGINPQYAEVDSVVAKALSEGTTTAGGFLTPTGYMAELEKRLPELSQVYPYVRKRPVVTDAGDWPSLATDVTITWGRAENASVTETDPVFGRVQWSLVNASAITFISRELVSDANPGIIEVLTELFTEAIAAERDKKICIGTGSSQPMGLVSATGISAISGCSGALTYAKLVSLKRGLAAKYLQKARWVMGETEIGWIEQLVDTYGRPIFVDSPIEGQPSKILGLPWSTQKDMVSGVIVVGDLGKYAWFTKDGEAVIESTIVGGDTFLKHQLGVKVIERCDGKPSLAEAFKKSGTFTAPA